MSAQIFTTPLIFYVFRQISIISPVANLLISFTIPPLMIFGFMAIFLGKINIIFGIIPSMVCYGIIQYILFVTHLLSQLPFAFIEY